MSGRHAGGGAGASASRSSCAYKCSLNPTTKKFFAYSPGWVPDPGNYRKSMWEKAGFPNGPTTWDELQEGGSKIKSDQGIQLGIGMSQEIDSNMAGRSLMWSYGGAMQDENENVTINSPETVAAVQYMKELFEGAMTEEVFAWNPASNNQGWSPASCPTSSTRSRPTGRRRRSTRRRPNDIVLRQGARGTGGRARRAARHVQLDRPGARREPGRRAGVPAPLHRELRAGHLGVRAVRLPGVRKLVPQLDGWLDNDPFGSEPPDKLAVLKDALDWTTNVGRHGTREHRDRRGVRHLHHPEHVRARGPRRADAARSRWPRPSRR